MFQIFHFRYFFGKSVTGVIHIQFVTRIKSTDLFLCDDYTDVSIYIAMIW